MLLKYESTSFLNSRQKTPTMILFLSAIQARSLKGLHAMFVLTFYSVQLTYSMFCTG